jgi:hypothetical protein
MQFTSPLTEADFSDVQKLTRPKSLRLEPAVIAGECILATLGIWSSAKVYLHRIPSIWPTDVTIGLFVTASIVGLFYRNWRTRTEKLGYLNATRSSRINVTIEGIHNYGSNGIETHAPWIKFASWREGRRVMMLKRTAGGFLILPVSHLPEVERTILRHLLQSHIGPLRNQPNNALGFMNSSTSLKVMPLLRGLSWFFLAVWAGGMSLELPLLFFFHPKWVTNRLVYEAEIAWWLCFVLSLVALICADDVWWGKVDRNGPKSLSEAIREIPKSYNRH